MPSAPSARRLALAVLSGALPALVALSCALLVLPAPSALASGSRAVPASTSRAVPAGFVGVNLDGPIFPTTAPGVDLNQQMWGMVAAGVDSIRVTFSWQYAQPYASWSKVPKGSASQYTNEGGIPTNFAQTDEIVALAAEHGLTVLPTVIYPPAWDVVGRVSNKLGRPARDAPYGRFLKDLIARYGPNGSFWTTHSPKAPIREWQIWNEPNVGFYWPTQPFAPTYVALLKVAAKAIRQADPGAKVVLAGIPNYSWKDLAKIYRVKGARSAFDVVAIHPYTAKPAGVITILRYVRQVMDQNGDARKPIVADEISWTSSKGMTDHNVGLDIATTEQGQANDIAALLPMLAKDRASLGLAGFDYYTWAGDERPNGLIFAYAGLLKYSDGTLSEKPALSAFTKAALAMEDCSQPGPLAGRCEKRP